ncbi:hypothetical protein [Hyphococcus sp.]|uniref:hypothetical protein n=1 Tax=Hyphococcus sp. TaxID=2038636 RepID=UPI0035C6FC7B
MSEGRQTGNKMRLHLVMLLLYGLVVLLIGEYFSLQHGVWVWWLFIGVFWLIGANVLLQTILAVRCADCNHNSFDMWGRYSPFWASKRCRGCGNELP